MATTSETGSDKRWWSERWWAVMESIGVARRLEHGKHYARAERVLSLEIEPGLVSADVQGSRYDPYHVEIGVDAFTDDEWHEAVKALASQALFSAKLLAGEIPENTEEAFSGVGLSLFPNSASELTMKCSCPDAFVPCKHIVAIHYVLADKLGADPFLLFEWRGRSRGRILRELGQPTCCGSLGTPTRSFVDAQPGRVDRQLLEAWRKLHHRVDNRGPAPRFRISPQASRCTVLLEAAPRDPGLARAPLRQSHRACDGTRLQRARHRGYRLLTPDQRLIEQLATEAS